MKHVEGSALLDDNQHGFRSGRSCQTALMSFTQKIFNELDKPNHVVVVVFIDLRKAFDSVVHLLLLRKLRDIYNVPRNILIVIGNYLFNRYYFIRIGKAISRKF
jgi:retron-type reverse transcriptase